MNHNEDPKGKQKKTFKALKEVVRVMLVFFFLI